MAHNLVPEVSPIASGHALRDAAGASAREADAYAAGPELVRGGCWRVAGHAVCCWAVEHERALASYLRAYVRCRDSPEDEGAIAETIAILRDIQPLVWPQEIGGVLSQAACLERTRALEMVLHVQNLGGFRTYTDGGTSEVLERISGTWRSVHETLVKCQGPLERAGDAKAAARLASLSREALSHAAGAAAEAQFKVAKFSQARQLAAAARELRPNCSFALARLDTLDLVATSHKEKRLDACDPDTLLRMLPPRVALVSVIAE